MNSIRWIMVSAALWAVQCPATDPAAGSPPFVLPLPVPEQLVPFPDWVPASVRGNRPGGMDSVLGMSAEWVLPPPSGRPGIVSVVLSNRMERVILIPRSSSPFEEGVGGILCLAAGAGGTRTALQGFPRREIFGPDDLRLEEGGTLRRYFRLPPELLAGAAGSEGLVLAYATRQEAYDVAYWADSTPLPLPAQLPEPGVAGTNEWAVLRAYWLAHRLYPLPHDVLQDFPEFAPLYTGVVLDASLPEDFRLEFAKRMPVVSGYNPAVYDFIVNAPDKDAPLVIAAMQVLWNQGGATPEESALRRTHAQALYAMSLDPQYPLLFRLHAAKLFRVGIQIDMFNNRTEPHMKLLAADEIRIHNAGHYYEEDRVQIRAGLSAISALTDPFEPGPLAGKYPDGATVGQVATIILTELEAKWAAAPARQGW